MPLPSAAADAAARRLMAAAGAHPAVDVSGDAAAGVSGGPGAPARDPVATAERAVADLADTLARWFGPYGTDALLTRALVQARAERPVLAAVRLATPRASRAPVLDGLAGAAQTHGTGTVTDGVTAVLAAAVDLLGRMIGEHMALQLVERSMEGIPSSAAPNVPAPPPAPGSIANGDRGAP